MAQPEKLSGKRTLRLYPKAEKRWSEENMFTLCEKCISSLIVSTLDYGEECWDQSAYSKRSSFCRVEN